jgi:CDP-glycerol glycerophosphotransferase
MKKNVRIKNIVKETIKRIITLILIFYSYVVPKRNNLLLFTAQFGDTYRGNPKFLYNHIKNNRKGYECIWVTNNKELYKQIKNKKIKSVYTYSLQSFWLTLRAKYFFIDVNLQGLFFQCAFLPFFGRFNVVQLWHGTEFKNVGLLDEIRIKKEKNHWSYLQFMKKRIFKIIIATSKEDKEKKIKSFANKNVYITGSPRNDLFFDRSLAEKDYSKELGLNKYNRVIVYAPTFRDHCFVEPFTEKFFVELNKQLKNKNEIFLIKKHPLDKELKIPKKYSNIKDITTQVSDVQELLLCTDLLITDYSAIVTDYILTNKPALFYIYDYDTYIKKSRTLYYDLKKTLSGPFIYDEKTLLQYLKEDSWSKTKEYWEKYKSFKDRFHKYQDGNSSKRVVELVLDKK